jgi:hypothetical protein
VHTAWRWNWMQQAAVRSRNCCWLIFKRVCFFTSLYVVLYNISYRFFLSSLLVYSISRFIYWLPEQKHMEFPKESDLYQATSQSFILTAEAEAEGRSLILSIQLCRK